MQLQISKQTPRFSGSIVTTRNNTVVEASPSDPELDDEALKSLDALTLRKPDIIRANEARYVLASGHFISITSHEDTLEISTPPSDETPQYRSSLLLSPTNLSPGMTPVDPQRLALFKKISQRVREYLGQPDPDSIPFVDQQMFNTLVASGHLFGTLFNHKKESI